jgi:phosphatidylinositol alpha 1,6-mannosyltransferase
VANTSRQYEAFARKRGFPFLIVCAGTDNRIQTDGSVTRLILRRGRIGFPLDQKHFFDLMFWRHYARATEALLKFAPDVIHITGPSDVGQLGTLIARRLRIPLAASWHTNLHQYAESRTLRLVRYFPSCLQQRIGSAVREFSLSRIRWFYGLAQILFAPNPELTDLLEKATGKVVWPMPRGVDTALFRPERRQRTTDDFIVGYVGRLTVEKNIRFLAKLEAALRKSGVSNFRFSIVGEGSEEPWLRANMRSADFAGVLQGEELARAYANMDVFVFPSRTDTFGNVVLEALASRVPVVVTDRGGPRFVVSSETGFVARSIDDFVSHICSLIEQPAQLQTMREAARAHALGASWDTVFEGLYAGYQCGLRECLVQCAGEPKFRPRARVVTSTSISRGTL